SFEGYKIAAKKARIVAISGMSRPTEFARTRPVSFLDEYRRLRPEVAGDGHANKNLRQLDGAFRDVFVRIAGKFGCQRKRRGRCEITAAGESAGIAENTDPLRNAEVFSLIRQQRLERLIVVASAIITGASIIRQHPSWAGLRLGKGHLRARIGEQHTLPVGSSIRRILHAHRHLPAFRRGIGRRTDRQRTALREIELRSAGPTIDLYRNKGNARLIEKRVECRRDVASGRSADRREEFGSRRVSPGVLVEVKRHS